MVALFMQQKLNVKQEFQAFAHGLVSACPSVLYAICLFLSSLVSSIPTTVNRMANGHQRASRRLTFTMIHMTML